MSPAARACLNIEHVEHIEHIEQIIQHTSREGLDLCTKPEVQNTNEIARTLRYPVTTQNPSLHLMDDLVCTTRKASLSNNKPFWVFVLHIASTLYTIHL